MSLVLGVDIGGTNITAGIVDVEGRILEKIAMPSGGAEGKTAVLANLDKVVRYLLPLANTPISAIGIGTAGEVDPHNGIITSATDNIPGWTGTRLKEYVQDQYKYNVYVDNDGNAAALAEFHYGAGRGLSHFVYLSLGTGVGGAVIADAQLLRGNKNYAAALGHTTINFNGPACNCGSTGCLENYVSGTAIGRSARQANLGRDAKELYEKAQEGDVRAGKLVAEIGFFLGCGLANFCNQFDPEAIIIGGGVSHAGDFLFKPAKAVMDTRVLHGLRNKVELLPAKFGEEAGLVGGATLALANI